MKIKINNKHFIIFCFLLLLVLTPAFYTYLHSREYLDFFILDRRVWEETAVITLSVLALIATFYIGNLTASLIGTVCVTGACVVLEPVYSYTVLPPIMAIWCFSRAREERKLYYSVFFCTSIPALISGFVVLLNNANDYFNFYYLNHKVFIIIFLSAFVSLNIAAAIWARRGSMGQKNSKSFKTAKKYKTGNKSVEKTSEQIFISFVFFMFIVLDVITVIIHGKNGLNYYLFIMIITAYFALFLNYLAKKLKINEAG